MKRTFLFLLSAGVLAHQSLLAGGALCQALTVKDQPLTLRVLPERDLLFSRGSREVIVQIELEGRKSERAIRAPINVAVVLDRSGSMEGPKLEKARQAAAGIVDRLEAGDVFSLVTYDSEAQVLIRAEEIGRDAGARERLKDRIHAIRSGGGTALHAGMQLGAEQARRFFDKERVNRILLLSDGLANVGPSRPGDLAKLGQRLRGEGISASTVGVGDDYNEDLMTALAESSHANYYYVQDAEKLPEVFARELGESRTVLARGITIRIEVPEGVRLREILGHPEIRCEGRTAEITLSEYFGADRRRFLARCEVETPASGGSQKLAEVVLNYADPATKQNAAQSQAALVTLTDESERAEASIRAAVTQEVSVVVNRLDKEKAVALADAGKAKEAAKMLRDRAAANAAAPAPSQLPDVAEENRKLEKTAAELETQGTLGKASRKQVQFENYQDKYQKR